MARHGGWITEDEIGHAGRQRFRQRSDNRSSREGRFFRGLQYDECSRQQGASSLRVTSTAGKFRR
jgi:hypothetical protein